MAGLKKNKIDGKVRCGWVQEKPHFIRYHDEEWGRPVHDDHHHFEMLILEGAQAGLSWETILLRREGYRQAFARFDPKKVANFDSKKKATLLKNPAIIRNRLKIDSAVTNAKAFLKVQDEFGSFDAYIWKFVGGRPKINHWNHMNEVPATSPESDALSKELKKRGFRFVGSLVMYAHMQAAGLVNDHTTDCFLSLQKRPRKQAGKLSLSMTGEPIKMPASKKLPSMRKQSKRHSQKPSPLTIHIKRVYEPPAKSDGVRVLIDRLWPRGLSKERAQVDLWLPNVAPSTTLRKWFNHEPSRWKEFQRRYRLELDQCPTEVENLLTHAQNGPMTLVYGAKDETYNNATALKAYLNQT